jgi:hypothetical protein
VGAADRPRKIHTRKSVKSAEFAVKKEEIPRLRSE